MATIITEEQKLQFTAEFKTASGNPATVDGTPTWSSSEPTIIDIQDVSPDGMSAYAVAQGPLGVAQVIVEVDADLGDGTRLVTGTADVEVRAAEAVSALLVAAAPEPK
jgi:hypothetical protein